MKRFCFYKERFQRLEEVSISPLDLGLTRSFGVFEYLRVYDKQPFHYDDHIKRFLHAAKALCIPMKYSGKEIKAFIERLITLTEEDHFGIKFFLTPGISLNGLLPENTQPTFLIYTCPLPHYSPREIHQGLKLKSVPSSRVFPEYKTINYLAGCFYLHQYKQKGFDDIIYKNRQGHFLEGVTANFFIFKNNILLTPHEEILLGVTRKIVLEIAQQHYDIKFSAITVKDLKEATGAFYTSTNMEVMPITQIDHHLINNKTPCLNVQLLKKLYHKHIEKLLQHQDCSSCL